MVAPNGSNDISVRTVANVIIFLVAAALTSWALLDETLPGWLVRLAYAGAVVAGLAATFAAVINAFNRR